MAEENTENAEKGIAEAEEGKTENEIEKQAEDSEEKKCDNNLTISTKLSTDQLICKSPQNSPNLSNRSANKEQQKVEIRRPEKKFKLKCLNLTLYLGVLQVLFGLLMSVFGVLAILHGASLSQVCLISVASNSNFISKRTVLNMAYKC